MDFKTDTYPTPKYTDIQSSRMMECLDFLAKEITRKSCVSCGRVLSFNHADIYDHDGGWGLIGNIPKQWISFKCDHCGYENSLNKLGVSR